VVDGDPTRPGSCREGTALERFADLLLRGGGVLTMDPSAPVADWVAIADGRIVGVGAGPSDGWQGPATRVVELAGRAAIPGLADVHTHIASNARDDRNVECRDFFVPTASVADILDRMARAAAAATDEEWVVAIGSPMQDTRLRERRRPTLAELDAAVPDRPAYLTLGAHILLANSAALRAVGVGPNTPDPDGGMFERDHSGQPTGVVRETAQTAFKLGRPGREPDLVERLHRELEQCVTRGVTTVHDIVKSAREVRAYQQLRRDGRLPLRVQMIPRIVQAEFETWSLADVGIESGFGDDLLRFGGAKVSVDGGSSAGQAAFTPTADDPPGWRPILRMTPQLLDEVVARYDTAGLRLFVHAVGDLALDQTLEAFERCLGATTGGSDRRHRIEHMGNFLMTDTRRDRATRLGLVPVPNPSNMYFTGGAAASSVGPDRVRGAYALRSILDGGLPLAFGSDGGGYWAVDPLRDIAAAVSRTTMEGVVIAPEQAITIEEGLTAQTRTAAWLGGMEDRLGVLSVGMLADLAVVGGNPLTATPDELRSLPVDLTITGGTVVYERSVGEAA
jgi:predicted amidohydrolase YtcJ